MTLHLQALRDPGETSPLRLLIVTTNTATGVTLRTVFEDAGFAAQVIGDSAIDGVTGDDLDLIMIDAGASPRDGIAAIERLRGRGMILPILMVSKFYHEAAALNAGADGFAVWPVPGSDLLALAKAILRRCNFPAVSGLVATVGDLQIDATLATAKVQGRQLVLTGKQFDLLAILARRPGQIMSRNALRDQLYRQAEQPILGAIDVFIHAIRRQLAALRSVVTIVSVRGIGFCVVTSALAHSPPDTDPS